jgi:hypothetical protein
VFFAGARDRPDAFALVIGSIAVTPLSLAICCAFTACRRCRRSGWRAAGASARSRAAGPDDPARALEPPGPPAEGWLRPGWLAGLPVGLGGRLPHRGAGSSCT